MQRGRQLRLYRSFQNVNLNILIFGREDEVRLKNQMDYFPLLESGFKPSLTLKRVQKGMKKPDP